MKLRKLKFFELPRTIYHSEIFLSLSKNGNGTYCFHYGHEEDDLSYEELKKLSEFIQNSLKEFNKDCGI